MPDASARTSPTPTTYNNDIVINEERIRVVCNHHLNITYIVVYLTPEACYSYPAPVKQLHPLNLKAKTIH